MLFSPKEISSEISKVYALASTLSTEDQIRFLDVLVSTQDQTTKAALLERAVIGERVWDKKQVG